jgi:hypothetical protein
MLDVLMCIEIGSMQPKKDFTSAYSPTTWTLSEGKPDSFFQCLAEGIPADFSKRIITKKDKENPLVVLA